MSQPMTEELLAQIPLSQLAARLGTDESTAREAAEAALPTLLAGITAQATDPARVQGLAGALARDHDRSLLEADDPVARVDPEEGRKIVGHVFGDRRDTVETELQGLVGGDGQMIGKLLPMLAPLVMAYLSGKMGGGQRGGGGGGLGDILGQVLGGAKEADEDGGGGLGDILGGVLGGRDDRPAREQEDDGGGGIGDILGSVFGRGKADDRPSGGVLDEVLDGIRDKQKTPSPLDDILGSILGR